jgi:tRNA modification GTPase
MNDTIVALATPPGVGGIAVIRISGKDAFQIADKLFVGKKKSSQSESHRILYGKIVDNEVIIDTVTLSIFKAPNSYTGENTVEISCHGGILVSDMIIGLCVKSGARLAEPGEFTKRAFLNGKLDLTQVEAVADIIHSSSNIGAITSARQLEGNFTIRLADFRQNLIKIAGLLELEMDFSEEDVEFVDRNVILSKIDESINLAEALVNSYKTSQIAKNGFYVALVGKPNAGKSSLFNALIGKNRAIVSHTPGTTRDYIEDTILIDNIPIRIFDTAGLRETEDTIEIEGIKLVKSIISQSNFILILCDISENITSNIDEAKKLKESISKEYGESRVEIIGTKLDLANELADELICISSKEGTNLNKLSMIISQELKSQMSSLNDVLVNQRHAYHLQELISGLNEAKNAIKLKMNNEVVAYEIRQAAINIGKITGEQWDEDVLNTIFSSFCIGK